MDSIYSSNELEQELGQSIKQLRLLNNISREDLCAHAGVSLTALRNLENARGSSVRTLILIARVLGKTDWLLSIKPQITINPLHMVKGPGLRQRAGRKRT
jgi:transcriptional regulator with XRE-family HTH domain